jgi:BirA family biotin operon repressor/biotin-[acetyl-CoA-carboxylase] ligase
MVNTERTPSTKGKVLEILRNADHPVSGEAIACALALSRVAIWKAVQSLCEAGYGIESGNSGYTLVSDPADSLNPWEFGPDERLVHHVAETDSTMNLAREAALSSCPDGYLIVADAQTTGRGTGSKRWDSVPGGLFFTIVTRPRLPAACLHRQVLAAQCALVRSLNEVSDSRAFAGWPNDILVMEKDGPKKAGGILAEAFISGNQTFFCNIGVGINTGAGAGDSGYGSVLAGRREILAAFRREFGRTQEFARTRHSDDSLVEEWNALCPDVNRVVRVMIHEPESAERELVFRGVDAMGFARFEQPIPSPSGKETIVQRYPPGCASILDKGRSS